MEIKIMKNIMSANEEIAMSNREYFAKNNLYVINIMASPGAGKTSIIIELIKKMSQYKDISVIEGDIASSIDSKKIEKMGNKVIQINTGGGCHLDANMIKQGIEAIKPKNQSLVFVENVGNLVCPSSFDLGESMKLVISSVPEGDDKPFKYISMFEAADIVVLNKIDLLNYVDFDMDNFEKGVKLIKPDIPIFKVSFKTGEGIFELSEYIKSKL